ncbi:unnamed protein product [Lactuca virosa]|uniref:Replication protein A 70 kDa DNA-binding subunit B/D first OB fold domain-containing protein n=1 Tax=Lactuca virosa TaxID=75947 RepID=A0AAU9ME61_9ASTR|nr:unnamed protein product [Lactuca virosa]
MILMDEEGRKIHASCVKKWFPKFKRYLKEHSSIYVKKPNVAPNTLKFKFADPERKLNFYHDTTVKECENFSGSAHGFDFVDFNTIVSNNILESNSFDIIRHIFEYGCTDTSEEDKSKHKMLLHLQDIEDTKLKFARVKFINGRPFSSTYFDVSRLFINNYIDEITSYKNKLVFENGQQLSSSGIKMIASKQDTKHDDFMKNHLFSNIDDLFEPLEEKTVIIVGTSAKEKESSTDKVDGSHEVAEIVTYECANPNCKNIKISVIRRFKIPLPKELYDKNKKPANSDSFMIGSSDIASQETKVVKDSFSHTGENLTPCARDNSTATSPTKLFSTPTELKRNLATCIDLDEMENMSTSKTPRLPTPDEQPIPLLVPKKEK